MTGYRTHYSYTPTYTSPEVSAMGDEQLIFLLSRIPVPYPDCQCAECHRRVGAHVLVAGALFVRQKARGIDGDPPEWTDPAYESRPIVPHDIHGRPYPPPAPLSREDINAISPF